MLNTSEKPSVVNLMEATSQQQNNLKKKVTKSGGKAQVMVHPFYRRYHTSVFSPAYQSPPGYKTSRDIFLRATLRNDLPLIIFEQPTDVEELPSNLPPIAGEVFLVETSPNSPDPIWKYDWDQVGIALREAGIKHAVLSGQILNPGVATPENEGFEAHFPGDTGVKMRDALNALIGYANLVADAQHKQVADLALKRWLERDIIPLGCVGVAAIGLMQNQIDVSFSPISSPEWLVNNPKAKTLFPPRWYSPVDRKTQ